MSDLRLRSSVHLGWALVAAIAVTGVLASSPISAQDTVTEVKFTVYNNCATNATFNFSIDGTVAGSATTTNPNCNCGIVGPPTELSITDSTTLASFASLADAGCTEYTFAHQGGNWGNQYILSQRVEITRALSGTETVCAVDFTGNDCADLPQTGFNWCNAGYQWESPSQPRSTNLADSDGDGTPDCSDTDDDGDGILDDADNCPTIANPGQEDSDSNGVGNACQPAVVTVPWLGNPNQPHQVYSGGSVVLQGVSLNPGTGESAPLTSATWDPGDGSGAQAISVADPRALELTHTYIGADGQPFTATLSATDSAGNVYTDTFKVVVLAQTQDVEVNMAIDRGLWNLHKRMQTTTVTGSAAAFWRAVSTTYNESATAGVVQAFEINGHRETGDSSEDPYVVNVRLGLRYLLGNLRVGNTSAQPGGDPDANGNGKWLGIGTTTNGNHETYITGQVMDAIVASGTPGAIATTGDATWVQGRTYAAILQDMLDAYSYGAVDGGTPGGWLYNWINNGGGASSNDSSSSHWWAIGVLASEVWGLDAPQWLKDQNWLITIPAWQSESYPSGCWCGYRAFGGPAWDQGLNTTAACLIMMNADDVSQNHQRFTCAENYINDRFNSTIGNFYAMYQNTKAMRTALDDTGATAPIDLMAGTRDWYDAYADHLVGIQQGDGSWDSPGGTPRGSLQDDTATSWAIIMLSPTLFELGPIASCSSQPPIDGTLDLGGSATFDGSGTDHLDPDYTGGLTYEWDFQDGNTGSGISVQHAFANVGFYNVELTVTDDNGLSDTTTCPIDVRAERIPPFASTGGPYEICLGDSLTLDGSGSRDLDTFIASWDWDWTAPVGDGSVSASGETVDASGVFNSVGQFDVALTVTDDDEFSADDGTSPGPNSSVSFTTVNVIPADDPSCNQPPVAVCAPREVSADASCQGTASVDDGSFDPDGAGDIASIVEDPAPPYPLGDTSVALTITDLSGEFDSCQAVVTVVDDTRPTLSCPVSVELECPADTSPANTGIATATDACDPDVAIAHSDSAVPNCGETETITRTWTATDAAGNVATCDQLITVVDTTSPAIATPADETLQCGVDSYVEPGAAASDTCDPTVTASASGVVDAGVVGAYTVTYDAVDACGNPAQTARTVSVVDTIAPEFTCPDPISLVAEAGCQAAIPDFGVTASDACTAPVVSQTRIGEIVGLGTHTVEISATDAAGNSSSCTTTVTVFDPDDDGVCGTDDVCAGTAIGESVPTKKHGTNRWALTDDETPFEFDTVGPNGSNRAYSTSDAGGCSCEQIIEQCGYGKGHTKFGCSNSVMDWWTGLFDQAGQPKYQCH